MVMKCIVQSHCNLYYDVDHDVAGSPAIDPSLAKGADRGSNQNGISINVMLHSI